MSGIEFDFSAEDLKKSVEEITTRLDRMANSSDAVQKSFDALSANVAPLKDILGALSPLGGVMKELNASVISLTKTVKDQNAVSQNLVKSQTELAAATKGVTTTSKALEDQTVKTVRASKSQTMTTKEATDALDEQGNAALRAIRALEDRNKAMYKTTLQLIQMKRGWDDLEQSEKDLATAQAKLNEDLKNIGKYIRPQLTKLEELKQAYKSLQDVAAQGLDNDKEAGISSAQYKRAEKALRELIAAEEAHQKSLQILQRWYGPLNTEIQKMVSMMTRAIDAVGQQGQVVLSQVPGWSKLSDEQKRNVSSLKAVYDAQQTMNSAWQQSDEFLKPAVTALQHYQKQLEALDILRRTLSSNYTPLMTDAQYQQELKRLNAELEQNIQIEKKRHGVLQETTPEDKAVASLRKRLEVLRQMGTVVPQTVRQQLEMTDGFKRLKEAEQAELVKLTEFREVMKRLGKDYEKALTPMQKFEQKLRDISVAQKANIASGGSKGITADTAQMLKASAASDFVKATVAAKAAERATLGLARGFNVLEQGAAASRAAMMGAGASFGIFTGQTLAAAAAAYGFARALKSTISAGMDFEYAFAQVVVLSSEVADTLARGFDRTGNNAVMLQKRIIDLAKATQFSVTEVTDAAVILARSGMGPAEIYQNLGDVLDLAAVGVLEMSKAADIATSVMAAFQMEGAEFSRAVDVIAATASKSKSNVEELGQAIKYMGPIAKQAGMDFEQISASLATLADAGIRSSQAGTSMRRIIINLMAPTERAQKAFQDLGISLSQYTRGGVLNLQGLMEALNESGATLSHLKDIFGLYAITAATALKEGTERTKEFEQTLRGVAGYAATVRDALRDNLKMQVEELTSTIQALQVAAFNTFGEDLTNKIRQVTAYINDNLEEFAGTLANVAKNLVTLIEWLVKALPTLINLGKAFLVFKTLNTVLPLFGLVGTAVKGLHGAFKILTGSALLLKGELVTLGPQMKLTQAHMALLATQSTGAAGSLSRLAMAGNAVRMALGGWIGILSLLGTGLAMLWMGTRDGVDVLNTLREVVGGLDTEMESAAESVKKLTNELIAQNVAQAQLNLRKLPGEIEKVTQELAEAQKEADMLSRAQANRLRTIEAMEARGQATGALRENYLYYYEKETEALERVSDLQDRHNSLIKQQEINLKAVQVSTDELSRRKVQVQVEANTASAGTTLGEFMQTLADVTGRDYQVRLFTVLDPGASLTSRMDEAQLPSGTGVLREDFLATEDNIRRVVEAYKSLNEGISELTDKQEILARKNYTEQLLQQITSGGPLAVAVLKILGTTAEAAEKQVRGSLQVLSDMLKGLDLDGGAGPKSNPILDTLKATESAFDRHIKKLEEIGKAQDALAKGTPQAVKALKELGLTSDEAAARLGQAGMTEAVSALGQKMTELDPRFKDIGKAATELAEELWEPGKATEALRNALIELEKSNPLLVKSLGGVDAAVEKFGAAAERAVSKSGKLERELSDLKKRAAEVRVAMQWDSFDDLVKKYGEAEKVTVALVYAQDLLKDSAKTMVPEQEQMASMQKALTVLQKEGIINEKQMIELLKQYGASLPVGGLKAEQEALRARISLVGSSAEAQELLNMRLAQFKTLTAELPADWEENAKAVIRLRKEFENLQETRKAFDDLKDGIAGAFADLFSGIDKSFKDTTKKLKDAFKKLIRDLIYQALRNRIVLNVDMQGNPISGGLLSGLGGLFGGGSGSRGGLLSGLGSLISGGASGGLMSLGGTLASLGMGSLGSGLAFAGGSIASSNLFSGLASSFGSGLSGLLSGGGLSNMLMSFGKMIPVIGAVLAVSKVIDSISGGKLFGTKFKFDSASQNIDFSGAGVGGGSQVTEVRNRSLFRGRKWRTTNMALDDETRSSMEEFWNAILDANTEIARTFGREAAVDVPASFKQEFDAEGNVTKEFGTILGRTYTEAWEEFAKRITAENILANLDTASDIAERWRGSAETLLDGAQFLLLAATDLHRGVGLLGEDGSLEQITDLIEDLAGASETLVDAYARVAGSFALFEQALILSGTEVEKTREELVRFAAEISEFAGGLDRATELWSGYFARFYSDAERAGMALAQADTLATNAFDNIGKTLQDFLGEGGVEAFRDLFESLLPDMSAQQVAQWLEAAEALGVYLDAQAALDEIFRQQTDILNDLRDDIDGLGLSEWEATLHDITVKADGYIKALTDAGMSTADATAAVNEWSEAMIAAAQNEALTKYLDLAQNLADQLAEASGATTYQIAMRDIDRNYTKMVKALNDAARAAGRAGASERDLARALELSTIQRANALAQLEDEARKLAEKLYGTPLSRIDDQIKALQEYESNLSGLSDGFGQVIRDASEAMALLLGSYSPLRAVDKLPVAMDALRRGETDANTVLQIARDVYGSGRAYNEIFAEVMQYADRVKDVAETGGTSVAVSSQMQALLDERDRLQAEKDEAERFQTATQLATLVAQLSTARGEDYASIAELLGFTLGDFTEDLRFDSLDDLTEYLNQLVDDQNSIARLFETPTAGDDLLADRLDGIRNALTEGPGLSEGSWTDTLDAVERVVSVDTETDEDDTQYRDDVLEQLKLIAERMETLTELTPETAERIADSLEAALDSRLVSEEAIGRRGR